MPLIATVPLAVEFPITVSGPDSLTVGGRWYPLPPVLTATVLIPNVLTGVPLAPLPVENTGLGSIIYRVVVSKNGAGVRLPTAVPALVYVVKPVPSTDVSNV